MPKKNKQQALKEIELTPLPMVLPPLQIQIPEMALLPFLNVRIPRLNFSLFQTPRLNFPNSNAENARILSAGSNDIWMTVISVLPAKDILKVIFSCKFLGEICNHPTIRHRLWSFKDKLEQDARSALFMNQYARNSFFQSPLPLGVQQSYQEEKKTEYSPT